MSIPELFIILFFLALIAYQQDKQLENQLTIIKELKTIKKEIRGSDFDLLEEQDRVFKEAVDKAILLRDESKSL